MTVIERVTRPAESDIAQLTDLLLDAVASGASVSFMQDLTSDDATAWWRKTFASASTRSVILIARDDAGIVGTVQLQPAWPPNQPHRADVAKLIVHSRARGRGIARALMAEVERRARDERFTLLVLDTCRGSAAERLYESLGWARVGEIPRYALTPDGSWCDTVYFYKQLADVD